MPSEAGPEVVRFGDYALDLRSGELLQNGSRLLLAEQPFRILALMVRRPGALVTRDDLRRELWPEDTFVDFEHSLNAAVKRLREVLGDSAVTPRFIETLPRRGYRFIGALGGEPPAKTRGGRLPIRWTLGVSAALLIVAGLLAGARVLSSRQGDGAPRLIRLTSTSGLLPRSSRVAFRTPSVACWSSRPPADPPVSSGRVSRALATRSGRPTVSASCSWEKRTPTRRASTGISSGETAPISSRRAPFRPYKRPS